MDQVSLETPMYITNNQQGLDFVWPRLSGLQVSVSVTGVFLVPDYRDLWAEDDSAWFTQQLMISDHTKQYYSHVKSNFCRYISPISHYCYPHDSLDMLK